MLMSSAVRYRQRTVLARQVFFNCSCAAGGAAPGATADKWRSSNGVMEFSSASQSRIIPIERAGENFANGGCDFGSEFGAGATDEQLLFRRWEVFVCRRHHFPRKSATSKYYAICTDATGGFFARRYRQRRARITWRKKVKMALALSTRRPIFSKRTRKSLRIQACGGANHLEILVVIEEEFLCFAARAQGAIAPILDGVQKHSRPQAAR